MAHYRPSDDDELPEDWALVTLPDICEINPPKPPVDALPPDATVTFVPMPAVNAEQGAITEPSSRLLSEVRKGFTAFRDEDVIMAKITPCMENGKAAIARGLLNGHGFGSTEFHVLRPSIAILAEYLYHFIRQESFREKAAAEMTGSVGQKRVPSEFLKQVVLPLPPLAEQQRIVAKVEALLARVNAARQRLAKVPAILKRFRQSVLAAACSGRLTADWREATSLDGEGTSDPLSLPESWTWKTVADLASPEPHSLQSGPFGSNLLHSEFTDEGVLAIGIDNVLDGQFSLGRQHRITPLKFEELKKYAARPLDVLITVMATVGRVCVVPADIERAIITKHVYRITVAKSRVDPFYLALALRDDAMVQPQIQAQIIGQTRPGINGRILRTIRIPIPSLLEQHEIVHRVEALFQLADAIEKRVAAATARAEKLTQAILAKAFRGELVPTEAELARQEGRDYEPASALLERIRAEQAAAHNLGTSRRLPRRPRRKKDLP